MVYRGQLQCTHTYCLSLYLVDTSMEEDSISPRTWEEPTYELTGFNKNPHYQAEVCCHIYSPFIYHLFDIYFISIFQHFIISYILLSGHYFLFAVVSHYQPCIYIYIPSLFIFISHMWVKVPESLGAQKRFSLVGRVKKCMLL